MIESQIRIDEENFILKEEKMIRVFLSFVEEDLNLVNFFRGQAKARIMILSLRKIVTDT